MRSQFSKQKKNIYWKMRSRVTQQQSGEKKAVICLSEECSSLQKVFSKDRGAVAKAHPKEWEGKIINWPLLL